MIRKILLLALFAGFAFSVNAQELNCRIQVSHQQVRGTAKETFETMRKDLYEFMNNQRWTNHVYDIDERIECTFIINITSVVGSEKFLATLQVQAARPVYGSNYTTALLNYKEKNNEFIFNYVEGQPIEFNEKQYTTELTQVMAFYAYVILGMDYDSFGEEGGSEFLVRARNIASLARSNGSSRPGWTAFESNTNRYHLIEGLMNDKLRPLRLCSYRYHRHGLDQMHEKPELARAAIAESLKLMRKAYRAESNSMLFPMFFTTKSDELIKIFAKGQGSEKQAVINILKETDPANASKYDKILQSK